MLHFTGRVVGPAESMLDPCWSQAELQGRVSSQCCPQQTVGSGWQAAAVQGGHQAGRWSLASALLRYSAPEHLAHTLQHAGPCLGWWMHASGPHPGHAVCPLCLVAWLRVQGRVTAVAMDWRKPLHSACQGCVCLGVESREAACSNQQPPLFTGPCTHTQPSHVAIEGPERALGFAQTSPPA